MGFQEKEDVLVLNVAQQSFLNTNLVRIGQCSVVRGEDVMVLPDPGVPVNTAPRQVLSLPWKENSERSPGLPESEGGSISMFQSTCCFQVKEANHGKLFPTCAHCLVVLVD